jgi:Flp pilus assembly pilin Flp
MFTLIRRFVREDEGQDLAEYALLIALIAVICIGGVRVLGTNLNQWYSTIATNFPVAS